MLQDNPMAHSRYLVKSIVIQNISIKRKRIPLSHTHIPESIKRIACFVKERTIAIHQGSLMFKLHVADQELGCRMHTLIKVKAVGMQEMHSRIRRLAHLRFSPWPHRH